jgi:hypothetical protein
MIMQMFLLFIGIAFLLTIVGFYIKENLLIIIGFLIFGLISIPLLNQQLEYKSGATINSEYFYNGSLIDSNENIIIYNYSGYTDTIWYGIFFLFISLGGLFMWYRGYNDKKEDD